MNERLSLRTRKYCRVEASPMSFSGVSISLAPAVPRRAGRESVKRWGTIAEDVTSSEAEPEALVMAGEIG